MKIKRTEKYMSDMGTALNGKEMLELSDKQLDQYSLAIKALSKGNDKLWKDWVRKNIIISG